MIAIGLRKSMPLFFAGLDRPALRFIDLFRLPDIEEPAVRLFAKALDFPTEVQRAFHRTID